ncbi:hypothetical protein FDG96_gp08 [Bacillus phage Mgbh1]|uniref:Uncharacterized protein n=1 Tax=Bacillus phage Mgbh1 TaxID=1796993 RepID=A0A142F1L0_9CAUD|nr:hypothetical protein FDG96_gp08 [Bacillus phage Mgbh1]AMQ66667.1 hypothetical protein [Bacillus phage Mgbh1]
MAIVNASTVYYVPIIHNNGERVEGIVFKSMVASYDEAVKWMDKNLHPEWSVVKGGGQ